jgi:hypothetical protein
MSKSSMQLRQSFKGASIRKAGFLTGIHALPPKVKNRLDELLLCRYSPEQALSKLEQDFPEVKLPSRSAVYTYKGKYLPNSLSKVRQVAQIAEELDIEKMNTASLFVSHLRRFIAVDLNVLQDRWYQGLEANQNGKGDQRMINEAGKMYMEAIKLGMDMLTKLNVDMQETVKPVEEPEEENHEDARSPEQKKLDNLLYMKYCFERRKNGIKLDNYDEQLADMFEHRGRIEMAVIGMKYDKELFQQPVAS